MSKRDYTKFSNQQAMAEPKVEAVVAEVAEPVVEEVVAKPVVGVVINCMKLNVRKKPQPNATILCEVKAASELVIDEAASTNDYYKVCTAAGVEGFCMKKYVSVMP